MEAGGKKERVKMEQMGVDLKWNTHGPIVK